MSPHLRRTVLVGAVCIVQLLVVGAAISDRLSARLTGEDYLLRVGPVDPIDPFRGAYVALSYPDLATIDRPDRERESESGEVYLPLVRRGKTWAATDLSYDRPETGPYLTCSDRDWRLRCGIESYFLPGAEAMALEDDVRGGSAVARVRIDDDGNAALIAVETE
jgi:uncharacterized membrane-anchored protein